MAEEKGTRGTGSLPTFSGGTKPGASSSSLPRVDSSRETPSRHGLSTGNLPRLDGHLDARLTSSANLPRVQRDARIPLAAQVRLQYSSILDFHESQSVNISRTGMFLASTSPAPVGTMVDFEFCLEDGLCLLKGKGQVVRVTQQPPLGMGVRFRELDEESRKCITRIVEINEQEGRAPRVPLNFEDSRPVQSRPVESPSGDDWSSDAQPVAPRAGQTLHGATRLQPGLSVVGTDLQVRLTPLTAGYFTNNPLINIRLGGFVVPVEEEVSLGASFDVSILDNDGASLFRGKGKVVAKDGRRIGIRLSDIAKPMLTRLQAEVARLSPGGK